MNSPSRPGGRYQRIVENIQQLPALPAIVSKLISVVNSPDTSAEDAADLIEKDPALTTKVLRLANSAFYGMPRSISSVSSAVVILGFNTLKSLVLSASVVNLFPEKGGASAFDRVRFWKHSIVCGMAARDIAQSIMGVTFMDPQSAFCAGIMHDIGKLIFELFTAQDYAKVCAYSREHAVPVSDAENALLGTTHAQIGTILADKWALPIELEQTIVYHHNPDAAQKAESVVAVVHLADVISHTLDCGLWDKEARPAQWALAQEMLDIDDARFDSIAASIGREIDTYKEFFSIINS
jgi:HD-like signal output (HDOD) protein